MFDLVGREARYVHELPGVLPDLQSEVRHSPVAGHARAPVRTPVRPPRECGDLPFVVRRDGTWLYQGTPIPRREMVCLFSGMLSRDQAGDFWLQSPGERGRIVVEETPWIAVEMDFAGVGDRQRLSFRTNVDQIVTAGAAHPIRVAHDVVTCDPTPYVRIRDGAGRFPLEARISRPVYYELVALSVIEHVNGEPRPGVWSDGCFFPIGELADDVDLHAG